MRTIKFRGKSLFYNEWSYGYPMKIGSYWHIITDGDFEEDGHHLHQISDTPTWVKEDTIGQFTGCLDANGKEIYEGDILEGLNGAVTCTVTWFKDHFALADEDKRTISGILPYFCKLAIIVGNIFDNPELLNKKDNDKI